jgi:hypothetical protein
MLPVGSEVHPAGLFGRCQIPCPTVSRGCRANRSFPLGNEIASSFLGWWLQS